MPSSVYSTGSSLGDIHFRNDFQTRADRGIGFDRKIRPVGKLAVDTVTNTHDFFKRLDMDIARAERNGLPNNGVNKLDCRRVDHILLALDLRLNAAALRFFLQLSVLLPLQIIERVRRRTHCRDGIDENIDLRRRDQHIADFPGINRSHSRHRNKIRRISHGDDHRPVVRNGHRNDLMLFQEIKLHLIDERIVDLQHVHLDIGHTVILAERGRRRNVVAVSPCNQILVHIEAQSLTLGENAVDVLLFDNSLINEKL